MNVEFRKTFEKDLKKIQDKSLLDKIKAAINALENATSLDEMQLLNIGW